MTENGPLVPDTVEYLANAGIETVHLMQMLDVNGRSGWSNPLVHFSARYMAELKGRCLEIAQRRAHPVEWDIGGLEDHDFRIAADPPEAAQGRLRLLGLADAKPSAWVLPQRVRPAAHRHGRQRRSLLLLDRRRARAGEPGRHRLRRDVERRAHAGPAPCALHVGLPEHLRFLPLQGPGAAAPASCRSPRTCSRASAGAKTTASARSSRSGRLHMTRQDDAPVLCFARPRAEVDRLFVVSRWAASARSSRRGPWTPASPRARPRTSRCPQTPGSEMRGNVGWWWAVFGFSTADPSLVLRSREIRCLIRHMAMPRIDAGGLHYPDDGHLAPVDLGSKRAAGTSDGAPSLGARREADPWEGPRRRHASAAPASEVTGNPLLRAARPPAARG